MSTQSLTLSICIPTYNREKLLKGMFQALLPQVAEHSEEVEVWVLDNNSSDNTKEIVELSRQLGPLHYTCNSENIGPVANVIKGPVEFASGEYVWVLGDHNLIMPDALDRILKSIKENNSSDIFYANFQCATFPDHWPDSAMGGYKGSFTYIQNTDMLDGFVDKWKELIRKDNALCTQLYAPIIRRKVWRQYWRTRDIPEIYTSGLSTYPHSYMIAETLFNEPAFYIGIPVLTIFNGAQSWSDTDSRAKVYFRGLPDLLEIYEKNGLSRQQLCWARQFAVSQAYKIMLSLLKEFRRQNLFLLIRCLLGACRYPYLWSPIWQALIDSECCWFSKGVVKLRSNLKEMYQYFLFNCRPARWVRNWKK